MTTDRKIVCAACGAEHDSSGRAATFACEGCGATTTNPFASPRPVARPVAKPVGEAAARPVAKPVAATPPPPADDLEMLELERQDAKAAGRASPRSRAEGGRAHTRVMSAVRPDFETKKKPPYAVLGVVAVVIVAAAAFFLTRGGDDKPKDGTNPPPVVGGTPAEAGKTPSNAGAPQQPEDASKGATNASNPSGATPPTNAGANPPTVPPVKQDPVDAATVVYAEDLAPFLTATYVPEFERDAIGRAHQFLTAAAAASGGSVKKKDFDDKAKPILDRYADIRKRYDELAASEFGQSAANLAKATIDDISQVFGGKAKFQWYIHPEYHPYLVIIEDSPAWVPSMVVEKDVFRPLRELNTLFLDQYGKSNNLTQLTSPVPVIFFESEPRYREYNESRGFTDKNVLAHFEPASGRLVLHRNCTHRTIMHEGTHQLFSRYAKNKVAWHMQSYWFEEGMAEWFGGANRVPSGDGRWSYEIGVIQGGRVNAMRSSDPKKHFKIKELVTINYTFKEKWKNEGGEGTQKIQLIYEQGWFLIYFLNYFDTDAEGYVKFGGKGKYKDGWEKYVQGELNGRTGKKAFEEALGLASDADWTRLQDEFEKYFDFVNFKLIRNHVKDDRLVPWDQYVNKRGEKTGEKENDLLVRPVKKDG